MKFDPVSDRRNFTTVKNPDCFKQQLEEMHATEAGGFAPDVLAGGVAAGHKHPIRTRADKKV